MWKDFFYFSKGQRVGVVVLLVLILLVLLVNFSLRYFFEKPFSVDEGFYSEVNDFKKSLVLRDSLREAEWQKKNAVRQREYEEKYSKSNTFKFAENVPKYTLFSFDPNKLDSIGFVRLGLKYYVASNILKYRKKGGFFRNKPDFGKVYGISPEKFKELEPYITIEEKVKAKDDSGDKKQVPEFANITVDLNSADTTLLKQVKGISSFYAKGIVRFRRETGGFTSVDQLMEVYGMHAENFERIRSHCFVNEDLIQKIRVNVATVEKLNAHPYINFYQAKALYELRRYKGKLKKYCRLETIIGIYTGKYS